MRYLVTFWCMVVLVSCSALAEGIPQDIKRGLSALRSNAQAAWAHWGKDIPNDDKADGRTCIQTLDGYRRRYGQVDGSELITTRKAGASYEQWFVLVKLEKKPVFMKFVRYRSGARWRITSIACRDKPEGFVPGFEIENKRRTAPGKGLGRE